MSELQKVQTGVEKDRKYRLMEKMTNFSTVNGKVDGKQSDLCYNKKQRHKMCRK